MCERYVIGEKEIPYWCRKYLTPYQRFDGLIGWEFWGKYQTFNLVPGDMLILKNGRIEVKRR